MARPSSGAGEASAAKLDFLKAGCVRAALGLSFEFYVRVFAAAVVWMQVMCGLMRMFAGGEWEVVVVVVVLVVRAWE